MYSNLQNLNECKEFETFSLMFRIVRVLRSPMFLYVLWVWGMFYYAIDEFHIFFNYFEVVKSNQPHYVNKSGMIKPA